MYSRRGRVEPGPGQESVRDHPRPPRVECTDSRVRVVHARAAVADTARAWPVLETSQAPATSTMPHLAGENTLRYHAV